MYKIACNLKTIIASTPRDYSKGHDYGNCAKWLMELIEFRQMRQVTHSKSESIPILTFEILVP